jgi:hypothetical protein
MPKYHKEEKKRSLMRDFDLGEGISVSMGVGDQIDYFFTNKVEGIKKSSKKALGDLEVEFSSTLTEDQDLLKKLHSSLR